MAEHKGKFKKESSSGSEGLHIFEVVCLILIVIFLLNLAGKFLSGHLSSSTGSTTGADSDFFTIIGQALGNLFASVFPTVELISIFVSVIFIMGIIYAAFRLYYLKQLEDSHKMKEVMMRNRVDEEQKSNPKWQRVLDHANSNNPSDWRLSILEADILLGDMLEKMGYRGNGIGDMLKTVEKSDFNTIDNAWEAHKIRNAIAHEGSDFLLSQKETQRAISLYHSVFEEFHFA